VLREEDGVSLHRSLLAVVGDVGGCETGTDEVFRVGADDVQAYFLYISEVCFGEVKAGTERRSRQLVESFFRGHTGNKKRRVSCNAHKGLVRDFIGGSVTIC